MQGDKIIQKFLLFVLGIFIFCQRNGVMEKHMKLTNISDVFMVVITRHNCLKT